MWKKARVSQTQDDEGFIVGPLLFSGPKLLIIFWIQLFFQFCCQLPCKQKEWACWVRRWRQTGRDRGRPVVRKVSAYKMASGNQSIVHKKASLPRKRRDRGNVAGTLLFSLDELARTLPFLGRALLFVFCCHFSFRGVKRKIFGHGLIVNNVFYSYMHTQKKKLSWGTKLVKGVQCYIFVQCYIYLQWNIWWKIIPSKYNFPRGSVLFPLKTSCRLF